MAASGANVDGDLMARVQRGDRVAFSQLVERHQDLVVRYVARVTGRPDDAEDLAQEAFVRVWQSAARYREEGQFRAWLMRVATNLVRTDVRTRERRRLLARVFLQPTDEDAGRRPDHQVLADEVTRRVTEAVADLPLAFREPLVLFELEGWSLEEIARSLGLRPGTVKSRLHRARARLRESLAPYWEENR